jgi:Uma2 family endonuclease
MAAVFPQKHLTTIQEWRRMGEAGILADDARMELIEGEILHMAPIGFNHAGHVARIHNFFNHLTYGKAFCNSQNPLQLGDLSEPQPDFTLLRLDADFYTTRHPVADDVLLLIEVSDTTLRFDRNEKRRLYASHGIADYWIVNLIEHCLEVHRQPQQGDYQQHICLQAEERLSLPALPQIEIAVGAIL